jgi:uncharacterized protein YdcH (DUF465 family)
LKKGDSPGLFTNPLEEVFMPTLTEELKRELAQTHEEFKNLVRTHHDFEKRLAELASKTFLSSDEEGEEKRLKKQKLMVKDRMEEIAREHRARVGASH